MDIASFHAGRKFAEVRSGRIAYIERGQGPVTLFVHGVPLNGYHWRHVIARVQERRRCVAIDLMGLGYSEIAPTQAVDFTAQARMLAEVLDALGVETVDLVSNDSGGAIAQIFAAHHPHRLTSLTLSNCDVHDGWPPHQVLPIMELARQNALAPIFQSFLDDPAGARARYLAGQSAPLFRSYHDPHQLTDEAIRCYLQPLLSTPQRLDAFNRYWLGFDCKHTVAVHRQLKRLQVPTLIIWGLKDIFFDRTWAYWLKDTIPGARRVVEVPEGRLFLPEDLPDAFTQPMLQFWEEL
ncbi:MAG: alpha/beta hydrolase [Alphaproteobacteria bacterium]|nr:alpha/beta hydrolase [Alphaproteobacteria bacterium]MCW5743892.1 alpha/beta hydrolase [Alphaproteobacteria bacterium]